MKIGYFTKEQNGCYSGYIPLLLPPDTSVSIIPDKCLSAGYNILLNGNSGLTLGQGTIQQPKYGDPYIDFILDAPMLPERIHCRLIDETKHGNDHALIWNRDERKDHARQVMALHAELKGSRSRDDVSDLLLTLLQYCDETGESFDNHLVKARWHRDEIPF
jgi:uncharacterized protein (DUF736 family)